MRTYLKKTRTLFLLCLMCAAAICALGVAAIKRQQAATHPPKVISKVKNLEVVGVTVEREGEPGATVVIVIRNNSDQAVVAVSVESGDDKDSSGISTEGFRGDDEPPLVVIEPYGTITMRMEVANLLPGKPLKVSGVMYADGSVDGEKPTIETIRGFKERAKNRGTKKGGSFNQ